MVWTLDTMKVLLDTEIRAVIKDLKRKSKRSVNTRQNLIIFRLATCCGLRVSEISSLTIKDVKLDDTRPHINLRKTITKGKKARRVPLLWDGGTLGDLTAWKAFRLNQAGDNFVCSQAKNNIGKQLTRQNLRMRYKAACSVLGPERVSRLTIHHGRHSFISHALAKGRSLAEVRQAVGHSNLQTTSGYLHIVVTDTGEIGNIFE